MTLAADFQEITIVFFSSNNSLSPFFLSLSPHPIANDVVIGWIAKLVRAHRHIPREMKSRQSEFWNNITYVYVLYILNKDTLAYERKKCKNNHKYIREWKTHSKNNAQYPSKL